MTTGQEPHPQQPAPAHQPGAQPGSQPPPPPGPFPPALTPPPPRAAGSIYQSAPSAQPSSTLVPATTGFPAQTGHQGQAGPQGQQPNQGQYPVARPGQPMGPGQQLNPGQQLGPGQFGGPYQPSPPAPTRGRRGWPGLTALALVVVLIGVVAFQALQIRNLNERLDFARAESQAGQDQDSTRFSSAEERVGALEQQLGSAFNAEKIAAATLPSVFRVRAGDFTGTAFAVGAPAASGGTNLFTNAHVVEQVWDRGDREVFLERDGKRHPATIVAVDKSKDVAHLRATAAFTGLKIATEPVKPGQQVVVVGAPLGLDDTVTSGVVSAVRDNDREPAIQFDAAINPGNSGGPVINARQQVVGIATAKARNAEGIGLAIPIAVACATYRIC